jgi:hypothetical protein
MVGPRAWQAASLYRLVDAGLAHVGSVPRQQGRRVLYRQ